MTKNWSEIGRFWTILYRIAVESKNHLKFQKNGCKFANILAAFHNQFGSDDQKLTENWSFLNYSLS